MTDLTDGEIGPRELARRLETRLSAEEGLARDTEIRDLVERATDLCVDDPDSVVDSGLLGVLERAWHTKRRESTDLVRSMFGMDRLSATVQSDAVRALEVVLCARPEAVSTLSHATRRAVFRGDRGDAGEAVAGLAAATLWAAERPASSTAGTVSPAPADLTRFGDGSVTAHQLECAVTLSTSVSAVGSGEVRTVEPRADPHHAVWHLVAGDREQVGDVTGPDIDLVRLGSIACDAVEAPQRPLPERLHTLRGLAALCHCDAPPPLRVRALDTLQSARQSDTRALAEHAARLHRTAVAGMAETSADDDQPRLPALETELHATVPESRECAVRVLSVLTVHAESEYGTAAETILRGALTDGRWQVRTAVADALAEQLDDFDEAGRAALADLLVTAVDVPDWRVRNRIIDSLSGVAATLSPEQRRTLRDHARRFVHDPEEVLADGPGDQSVWRPDAVQRRGLWRLADLLAHASATTVDESSLETLVELARGEGIHRRVQEQATEALTEIAKTARPSGVRESMLAVLEDALTSPDGSTPEWARPLLVWAARYGSTELWDRARTLVREGPRGGEPLTDIADAILWHAARTEVDTLRFEHPPPPTRFEERATSDSPTLAAFRTRTESALRSWVANGFQPSPKAVAGFVAADPSRVEALLDVTSRSDLPWLLDCLDELLNVGVSLPPEQVDGIVATAITVESPRVGIRGMEFVAARPDRFGTDLWDDVLSVLLPLVERATGPGRGLHDTGSIADPQRIVDPFGTVYAECARRLDADRFEASVQTLCDLYGTRSRVGRRCIVGILAAVPDGTGPGVEDRLATLFADAVSDETGWARLRAMAWLTAHPTHLGGDVTDDVLAALSESLDGQAPEGDRRQLLLDSMTALLDGPVEDEVTERVAELLYSLVSEWDGRGLRARTTNEFETEPAIAIIERPDVFEIDQIELAMEIIRTRARNNRNPGGFGTADIGRVVAGLCELLVAGTRRETQSEGVSTLETALDELYWLDEDHAEAIVLELHHLWNASDGGSTTVDGILSALAHTTEMYVAPSAGPLAVAVATADTVSTTAEDTIVDLLTRVAEPLSGEREAGFVDRLATDGLALPDPVRQELVERIVAGLAPADCDRPETALPLPPTLAREVVVAHLEDDPSLFTQQVANIRALVEGDDLSPPRRLELLDLISVLPKLPPRSDD
ncbi:hypothetical protein [Haloarcula sediminis]|uniref:hypothetical protein n=1 Tax=Haloarcula sediminis TaxID=3111777 RepID=UPI002D781607|nr:hypothetical protein [Haloarcula sp. CK38]